MKQFCDSAAPRRQRPISDGEAGLTLIEMIIVLVIIAIVSTLIVMNVFNRPDEAKVTINKTNLSTIAGALKMYRLDTGTFPTTEQGLKALVEKPTAPPVPDAWAAGGYLPSAPLDPWGRAYVYAATPQGFVIKSLGRDGKDGGEGIDQDVEQTG